MFVEEHGELQVRGFRVVALYLHVDSVPVGVGLQNLVSHGLHCYVDSIVDDVHCVCRARHRVESWALVNTQIVESLAVASVHSKVLPHHVLGVGVACELAQPRCRGAIVNLVGAFGHQFDAVLELVGVQSLQTVKRQFGLVGEAVAEEHLVVLAGEERESDVGAVLYRSVAQRFAASHWSGSRQIVGIE